ncbi:hypothetical protein BURMUCF2_B0232 [Burkholderia multivorans CF2]|nr:hypothetical protein BURMUCF2_B0232 [Burkholderia multivorans CF2]
MCGADAAPPRTAAHRRDASRNRRPMRHRPAGACDALRFVALCAR